ncbi:MAG: hypothetical protein ACLGGO_05705 [Coleofasciculus sp.]
MMCSVGLIPTGSNDIESLSGIETQLGTNAAAHLHVPMTLNPYQGLK